MLALAITRNDIANYVQTLFFVYILIIFVYLLLNMIFTMGVRPPYSRVADSILGFLRDVSEPYLRIFRKFIPTMGMFDFSPLVALAVLWLLQDVLYSLIHT